MSRQGPPGTGTGADFGLPRRVPPAEASLSACLASAGHDESSPAECDHILSQTKLARVHTEALLRDVRGLSRREVQERLQGVVRSLAQLDQQVRNITSSRRLAEGGIVVEWQDVDVADIIRSLAQEYRRLYGPWRIKTFVERALPTVLGDRAKVEQAVANLLDNAIRYCPSDTAISVGARRQPGPEGALARHGAGATPCVGVWVHSPAGADDVGELEELFESSQAGCLAALSGAGLGLYVCRGTVEAHGGRIALGSQPPRGVTFSFYLPLGGGPMQLHLWDAGQAKRRPPVMALVPEVPDTVA